MSQVTKTNSNAKVVSSTFNRLDTSLKSYALEKLSATAAAADDVFKITSDLILSFTQPDILPIVIQNFSSLLDLHKDDEIVTYLILKLMHDYIQKQDDYSKDTRLHNTLQITLILQLLTNLVRARSCYETRIIISVYLGLSTNNSVNDLNAALHQTNGVSSDHYIDIILRFLSTTNTMTYFNSITVTLVRYAETAPLGTDAIYALIDSKLKYGLLECLSQMSNQLHTVPTQVLEIHNIVKKFRRSEMFCQILCHACAPSIMNWIETYPEDFAKFSHAGSIELFEILYDFAVKLSNTDVNPTVNVLNYNSLMALIIVNNEIFVKFEKYLKKKETRLEPSYDASTLSSGELKMFSVLLKLIHSDKANTIDDKHLMLKCMSSLLVAAVSLKPLDPNHVIVQFVTKYFMKVYDKIKDVCFALSSFVSENPLIEYVKLDFLACAFVLMPEDVFPIIAYYIDNYSTVDFYSYYIAVHAIKIAGNTKRGKELVSNTFLNLKYFETLIQHGLWVTEMMRNTYHEYKVFLEYTSAQKANLLDSSLLDDHATAALSNKASDRSSSKSSTHDLYGTISSTTMKKVTENSISESHNNNSSDTGFQIDYTSILSNVGYLSRKVYDTTLEFICIAPTQCLPLDECFIADLELLKSDELFNKATDTMTQKGFVCSDIIVTGIADCQLSSFEMTCRFLTLVMTDHTIRNEYRYYSFASNLKFLKEWTNILLRHFLHDSQGQIHQITFAMQYAELLMNNIWQDIDFAKFFEAPESLRTQAFLELLELSETFLFVVLCGSTAETFNCIKKIVAVYSTILAVETPLTNIIRSRVNWKLIQAIASDHDFIIKSQKYLQKKINQLLLDCIDTNTPGLLNAIGWAYEKIKGFFHVQSMSTAESHSFYNHCAFLCTGLGFGVSLDLQHAEVQVKASLAHEIVTGLITMVSENNPKKKNVAKEILANNLHPNLAFVAYRAFRTNLAKMLKKSETQALDTSDSELVRSYSLIIEKMFSRLPGINLFQSSASIIFIANTLIDILKHQFKFLNTAGHTVQADRRVLIAVDYAKNKLSVVRLLNLLFKHIGSMRVAGTHLLWRNEIFKVLLHWLEGSFFRDEVNFLTSFITSAGYSKTDTYTSVISFTYKDIVNELLSCLSLVSSNLPIMRPNINYEKEVTIFRTIMFSNYFNVLIRILRKTLSDERVMNAASNNGQKISIQLVENDKLVANTIKVLSNLVKSNYEIGSGYVLSLITDDNLTIKSAFLQILKNIFKDSANSVQIASKINSAEFKQFCFTGISDSNFLISVRNSVTTIEMENVSNSLLTVLDRGGKLQTCLGHLIQYELETCLKPLDILRRNNLTTKLLSSVGKKYGGLYLKNSVGKVLDSVIVNEDYFEVDQFYQGTDAISAEDSGKFFYYFTLLVNSICDNFENVPDALKATCYNLRNLVMKYTNDNELSLTIIGTFFFLRFVCPAIAYPEELDLINYEPTPQAKRCFVLLTKALQNASNGTLNIDKFPLLKGKEIEIKSLVSKIATFVDNISSIDIVIPKSAKTLNELVDLHDFKVIYTFIVNHAMDLRELLCSGTHKTLKNIHQTYGYYKLMDMNLEDIGYKYILYYPDVSEFIKSNKNKYIELYDLINRSLHNPLTQQIIENKFLCESVAKDGTQVFAITYSYFKNLKTDPQILAARCLQSLSRMSTSTYYVVVDCTLHNEPEAAEVLKSMISILIRLTPEELAEKCAGVSYINVSSVFAPSLVKLLEARMSSNLKFLNPRFMRYSFLSVFEDIKVIESFNLSDWTYSVSRGGRSFVNDVVYHDEKANKTYPVSLKLTDRYVLYSVGESKKIKVGSFAKSFKVVNFETLTDWKDLKESSSADLAGSFEVYSGLMGEKLKFASFKRKEIISTFYLNIGNYQTNVYNANKRLAFSDRQVNTKELLGEALISVGLGLLNNSEKIRRNAHDLLFELQHHFKTDKKSEVTELNPAFDPPKSYLNVSTISTAICNNNPHLTTDVANAFIYIIKKNEGILAHSQAHDILLFMSPWLNSIYKQVFLNDKINGPEVTQSFIASVVKNIPTVPTDLVKLNYGVWKKMADEEAFVEILVEETIKEVLNRELSDINWDNLITLMASNPNMKACYEVLHQLIECAKLSKSIIGQNSRVELYWIKVRALLEICITLFFDRVFFVERFLPQILFICSIFQRTGTRYIKSLIHQLTINCYNTLATNETLSTESKAKLKEIVKWLTGKKAAFAYGLHGNSTYIYDADPEQSVTEYHTKYFTAKLINTHIVDILSIPEYRESKVGNLWVTELVKLSSNLVDNEDSLFQIKSLRLMGYLATMGINDLFMKSYLLKIREYIERADKKNFSMVTVMSYFLILGKVLEGLQNESVYFEIIIMIGTLLCFYNNIVMFESGFFIFSKTIIALNSRKFLENGDMWGIINRKAEAARPLLAKFLTKGQLRLAVDSDILVASLFTKAWAYSLARSSLILFTLELASARLINARKVAIANNTEFNLDALSVIVPLYIGHDSEEQFKQLIADGGFEDCPEVKLGGGEKVSEVIVRFLLSSTRKANLSLIIISQFFCLESVDIRWRTRYLRLIRYLADKNRDVIELVYPLIDKSCMSICEKEDSKLEMIVLINEIQAIAGQLFNVNYAKQPLYEKVLQDLGYTLDLFAFGKYSDKLCDSQSAEQFRKSSIIKTIYLLLKYKESKSEYIF